MIRGFLEMAQHVLLFIDIDVRNVDYRFLQYLAAAH